MGLTKNDLNAHLFDFKRAVSEIRVTNQSGLCAETFIGVSRGVAQVIETHRKNGIVRFIGNGGSAAIAIHQATDFIRTCKIAAHAPLDISLLTCMGNDVGYENVFAEPLRVLGKGEDVLIAISSSGQSENILNGVRVMREKGAAVITLSGFKEDNPLRRLGDINFYVPSESYRIVESAHLFICNWLLEFIILALKPNLA